MATEALEDKVHSYVPGTVYLLQGGVNEHDSKDTALDINSIILHPQPSEDPNDPLRWSQTKKMVSFSILVFSSFAMGISIVWSGPVWEIWIEEFGCSYGQLNVSVALCFIFLALGCFLLQPIATKYGKRIVYLICTLIQIIGSVVYITASSIQSIWAASALCGFSASPIYAIVILSTTDIFFQHELAFKVSIVVFTIFGSTAISPLVAGYISSGADWRWCPKVMLIWFCFLSVLQFFFMEETSFRRSPNKGNIETIALEQIVSQHSMALDQLKTLTKNEEVHKVPVLDSTGMYSNSSIPLKSLRQRLKIVDSQISPDNKLSEIAIWPLKMYFLPIVLWCGVIQGLQQVGLSFMVSTQALFFSAPPYNFSTSNIGLTNLATLIGVIIGTGYGILVDKTALWFAKRNRGIYEPEFRLWTLIPPVIANAGGLLMYGLGAFYATPWIIPMVGDALIGFSLVTVTSIAFTYCCDCYPELENSTMVAVGILNNIIPIAFSFCVSIWIDANGLKLVTWMIFFICLFCNTSLVGLLLFGKAFRRSSIKQLNILLSANNSF